MRKRGILPGSLPALLLLAAAPSCVWVTAYETPLDRALTDAGAAYLEAHPVRMVDESGAPVPLTGAWEGAEDSFELITVERRHRYPPCSNYLMFPVYANIGAVFGWTPGFLIPFWFPDSAEVRVTRWDGSYELVEWEPAGTTRIWSLWSWFLWIRPDYDFGAVDEAEVSRRVFVTMVNRLAAAAEAD